MVYVDLYDQKEPTPLSLSGATVLGWVSQETDSHTEMCTRGESEECLWGQHPQDRAESAWVEREELNCDAVTTKASDGSMDWSGAGMALQNCSSLKLGNAAFLALHLSDGCSQEGGVILGEEAPFSISYQKSQ